MKMPFDLLVNFLGKGMATLLALLAVPIYINELTPELFGVIALFMTFQGVSAILDLGLTSVVVREVARYKLAGVSLLSDFVATIGKWYGLVALLIALISGFLSMSFEPEWLGGRLGAVNEQKLILMMGVAIAFQWPVQYYVSVMMGLSRQLLANFVLLVSAILKWGGGVFVLQQIEPSLEVFFFWQIIASALTWIFARVGVMAIIDSNRSSQFSWAVLMDVFRVGLPMVGVSIVGAVLSQLDRLILSLSVAPIQLGYYTMATMLSSVLFMIAIPFQSAVLPRFSMLFANQNKDGLAHIYTLSTESFASVAIPVSVALSVFSFEVVLGWTGSAEVANKVAPILFLLAIGAGINASMYLPLGLQLVSGVLRTPLLVSVLGLIILLPGMYIAAVHYSLSGVALVWLLYNVVYAILVPYLTHKKILKNFVVRWWVRALLYPFVLSFLLMWIVKKILLPQDMLSQLLVIFITIALCSSLLVMSNRDLRFYIVRFLK